jgi:hypothetical protein
MENISDLSDIDGGYLRFFCKSEGGHMDIPTKQAKEVPKPS